MAVLAEYETPTCAYCGDERDVDDLVTVDGQPACRECAVECGVCGGYGTELEMLECGCGTTAHVDCGEFRGNEEWLCEHCAESFVPRLYM